ncbi:FecR domain-containing protein [uncultured Cyclobacterium sp.]|uniref:FecR family protein n=1 Tax=uncultured Cyclobacterium sp. TaxID=453820 RepID=UPI0030EE61B0
MNKEIFITLLKKQANGEASREEIDQIRQILDLIQRREIDWSLSPAEEQVLKNNVKLRIDERRKSKQVSFKPLTILKWAAVLLIGFSLTYILYSSGFGSNNDHGWVDKVTSQTQKGTFTLPDGSTVFLNTNSRIRFPLKFSEDKREVILEGEGFFDVVKNKQKPFEVISNGVLTRVLGTSFNINATNEELVEVIVASGKVGVTNDLTEGAKLNRIAPNQKATVNRFKEKVDVEEVDIDEELAWKAEKMSFDFVPFEEVIATIGSMYHIQIEIQGDVDESCTIRSTYSNKSLYSILYGLKNIVDFDWEKVDERKIIINYKSCIN